VVRFYNRFTVNCRGYIFVNTNYLSTYFGRYLFWRLAKIRNFIKFDEEFNLADDRFY